MREKFLYEKVANSISHQITKGVYKASDRLPSVRKLSEDLGVSLFTILQSYAELKNSGLIDSKPGSGYYVRARPTKVLPEPETLTVESAIKNYKNDELVSSIHEAFLLKDVVSFGAGVPSADMLLSKKINRILSKIVRASETAGLLYDFPPGNYKLRNEIVKLSLKWQGNISPEDIIITTGGIEAIVLALKATAKPGDTIITESPTFYMLLQVIKNLGMNVLELPTNPKDGIEIEALKKEIKKHKVSACVLYPTINSPLGSVMPEENRIKTYNLCAKENIPIIECDVWGDLYFNHPRPKPIKALDETGIVLYISSFTKTGAPGYRVGWVCPGRYYKKVKELKYMYSISTPAITQLVIAEYLKSGAYETGLKNLRKTYSMRLSFLSECISKYFPNGTKMTRPQGGAFIWIELPEQVDTVVLRDQALKEKVSIAPGPLFSTTDHFPNFMRLSCACEWEPSKIENAVKELGELCKNFI